MSRSSTLGRLALSVWGVLGLGSVPARSAEDPRPAAVSTPSTVVVSPELAILQALRTNPITAPYPISATWRGGRVVLSGVVGTKTIHDTAVRIVIESGYPVGDNLTIDTAAAYRVAASAAMPPAPGLSMGGNPYYVYPPPLFGRLDDPFFGFEPPLLSYPPWWRGVAAREPLRLPSSPALGPVAPGGPAIAGSPPAGSTTTVPLGTSPKDGAVEMTIDPRGVAVLRGTVPSLADRVAIGQQIAQTPGVTEVINELNVGPMVSETPPPPPQPAAIPGVRRPAAPEPAPAPAAEDRGPRPAVAVDRNDLTGRVEQAIAARPALAGLPIKVSVRDGVASLSGRVPTVYEAMLAFRAVQQSPGIHEVDDRLEFVVPDGQRKNPLLQKGRPEDVEPYLTSQIRRQVGDIAHIDQVRLRGETLEIRGTLLRDDDRPRLDAILRSMPVLRDFHLDPQFLRD